MGLQESYSAFAGSWFLIHEIRLPTSHGWSPRDTPRLPPVTPSPPVAPFRATPRLPSSECFPPGAVRPGHGAVDHVGELSHPPSWGFLWGYVGDHPGEVRMLSSVGTLHEDPTKMALFRAVSCEPSNRHQPFQQRTP